MSYFVSNVNVGDPAGTDTERTIAASLLSASGAASAASPAWSGAAVVTVHSTGSGSSMSAPWNEIEWICLAER